jgi:hypothetical protein
MLTFLIQHQADRSFTNPRGKLVRRLAHRRPFLSGVRASGNPGAVHFGLKGAPQMAVLGMSALSSQMMVRLDLEHPLE